MGGEGRQKQIGCCLTLGWWWSYYLLETKSEKQLLSLWRHTFWQIEGPILVLFGNNNNRGGVVDVVVVVVVVSVVVVIE